MKMDSENSRRALSIRLPPALMLGYSNLIEGAGLRISENIRSYVQKLDERAKALEENPIHVEVKFNWRDSRRNPYPECVGAVYVSISPPAGMTGEDLDRIVFVTPEFFDPQMREPFRVDSYYFNRVAEGKRIVDSLRVKRHVLSFSTVKGRWYAGVFRYHDEISLHEIAKSIEASIVRNITATVRCFQLDLLPPKRLLHSEDVATRIALIGSNELPDESSFESLSG
jgi:hypothetical protein